jgi:peptidoglycan/LPS O-acetylase OafA/YrhL
VAAFTQAGLAVRVGVLLTYWIMLFAGAWLLYQAVEEPGRAWLRSLDRPRRRLAVTP